MEFQTQSVCITEVICLYSIVGVINMLVSLKYMR